MTRAAIALGSNLGDRRVSLRFGAVALAQLGTVVSVSSLYETAPIGGPEQEAFFNAVIVINTDLEPRQLLDELHRIEAEAGRVREVRWGPRRLDLDLILYGTRQAEDGGVVVPHPRFAERRFVLEPLVEAWPEATTPRGRLVADLLPGVADQEVVSLGTWWPEQTEQSGLSEGVGGASEPGPVSSSTEPPPIRGSQNEGSASTFAIRGGWWVVAQVVIGAAVVLAVLLFDHTIEGGRWLGWLGAGLVVVGAAQAAFGLLHLGVSLTPYPEPLEFGQLVRGGVYRYVRHPVYGGIVLGMEGLALYEFSWVGLVVASGGGIFFWLKAGFEERRLIVKYPHYLDYRARTRARLIPWIV
ncbi:MAG: 2-amino-4-hydroxy-6-hydroxymethyldihydropteridine diphosphokinase [Acidimicrobiia bacterium]|nr:2-amino-4-hydroxy-6-hydroxymethyldihydropteridine diphosphokinase [Acidimicrobiia bacterium]MDH3398000.1 2-amino-4-hydroxy-6-hydroxymethyldihydropteridine diphosphokinase [Acidimicrobiia bacterium]